MTDQARVRQRVGTCMAEKAQDLGLSDGLTDL